MRLAICVPVNPYYILYLLQPHHLLQPNPQMGDHKGKDDCMGFPGQRRWHRFKSRAVIWKVPDARAAEPVPRQRKSCVPYSVAVPLQLTQHSEGEESGSKRSRSRPHPPSHSERIASPTSPTLTPCFFPFLFHGRSAGTEPDICKTSRCSSLTTRRRSSNGGAHQLRCYLMILTLQKSWYVNCLIHLLCVLLISKYCRVRY